MKLLFDQNISHKLVALLADTYPGSQHVRVLGLHAAPDEVIWTWAKEHDCTIVSKDSDFHQRSFVRGCPPKVVCLRLGNCSTARIAACLREHHPQLQAFHTDEEAAFLVLGRR